MGILHIVGTRPNFIKAAPVVEALKKRGVAQWFIHTGQHYDEDLSGSFFRELSLPKPDLLLNVKNSLPLSQFVSQVYLGISTFCKRFHPRIAIVYGDVNSTLAATLACQRLKIPVAHIEAGLRSFDNSMQEEVNRILVDHLSKWLFTTEPSANANLLNEGIRKEKIYFVGNCMIDTLKHYIRIALNKQIHQQYCLESGQYLLCTFHRSGNVDNPLNLKLLQGILDTASNMMPVIFPVHPRTRKMIKKHNVFFSDKIILSKPLSYIDFVGLMANAKVVLTDSGGIQEETTWLNVPCLTMRPNTERPITIDKGTNTLVHASIATVIMELEKINKGIKKEKKEIPMWDGVAGERIADVLLKNY